VNPLTQVVLRDNESFDSLLKRFRKAVTRERILSDVRKRRFYVSPSEQRHKALRKAVARERKRQQKLERRNRG
jgi:small subunit ribosomal protein S21